MHKIRQNRFFLTRIMPYKNRIIDWVLTQKNTDQREPIFRHTLQIINLILLTVYITFSVKDSFCKRKANFSFFVKSIKKAPQKTKKGNQTKDNYGNRPMQLNYSAQPPHSIYFTVFTENITTSMCWKSEKIFARCKECLYKFFLRLSHKLC